VGTRNGLGTGQHLEDSSVRGQPRLQTADGESTAHDDAAAGGQRPLLQLPELCAAFRFEAGLVAQRMVNQRQQSQPLRVACRRIGQGPQGQAVDQDQSLVRQPGQDPVERLLSLVIRAGKRPARLCTSIAQPRSRSPDTIRAS
jgi:hypothetical protein